MKYSMFFRKNGAHKIKYSHPGNPDYDVKDNRPECQYGVKCYRKDPKHKRDFKHTIMRRKRAQTPITRPSEDSGSDQSSYEESVDESDFDLSAFDESSDDEN